MEIERKWLIKPEKIPYDLSALERERIEQSYVSFYPTIRIRKINDEQYVLTVKTKPESAEGQLARNEYEMPLSRAEYESLERQRKGGIVAKTRYLHPVGELTEEIDIFSGELEGLAYLEIEFPDEQSAESYPDPSWVEKDVSCDYRYKNSTLAEKGMPI